MPKFILLTLLLGSLLARAECATPWPFVLPRPGTALPPNPTLYFFLPPDSRVDVARLTPLIRAVSDTGLELKLTLETVKGGGDLKVVRVKLIAEAGVNVHLEPDPDKRGSWPVVKGVAAPGRLKVKRGPDREFSWACSSESLWVFETSIAAPAYRVDFAETEEALRSGKGESAVVEGDNDAYPLRPQDRPPVGKAMVLGQHSCWGSNFEWKSAQLALRVTALLSDGTERRSDDIFVFKRPPPE